MPCASSTNSLLKVTGAGNVVVFTESLTTGYLRDLLFEHGYDAGDITLLCGVNEGTDVDRALAPNACVGRCGKCVDETQACGPTKPQAHGRGSVDNRP